MKSLILNALFFFALTNASPLLAKDSAATKSSAQANISSEVLARLDQYLANELESAQAEKYATHLSYADPENKTQTDYIVVIFHGLFDSPEHLRQLHEFLFKNFQQNTISIRMPGHFDKNLDLADAKYIDWIKAFTEHKELLQKLGNQFVFVGHSNGGIMATLMANTYPAETKAVIAVAPAYGVTWWTKVLTWVGGLFSYDAWEASTGRRKVARLGNEVEAFGKHLKNSIDADPSRLADILFLIVGTEIDGTVLPLEGKNLLKNVPKPENRKFVLFSAKEKLQHRNIAWSEAFFAEIHSFWGLLKK